MRGFFVLLHKEIKDIFLSPLIYILSALFSAMTGWLFFNYIVQSKHLSSATITSSVLTPLFGNMNFIFLFLAPLLTMKSFAGEKKQHTLQLLFLSDLGHFQIIFAKFMAALFGVLFMLSLTVLFPTILAVSGYSDWGSVSASYAGLIFSIMCYLSVGLFTSSLTDNQIIAAISGFCILLLMMLMVLTANATDNFIIGQIFQYLSIAAHYEGFVRGTIKSYDLIYYASFVGFAFFLTNKSLDSRNW